MINYVALLGASYEEGKDIYTLEELAERFGLEKLNKAPAIFDYKKLEWYNGQYIRMKSDKELADLTLPFAVEAGIFGNTGKKPQPDEVEKFVAAMPLVRERAVFLKEIPDKIRYLFSEPPVPAAEDFIPKKAGRAQAINLLKIGRELVSALSTSDDTKAEELVKGAAEKENVKLGDLLMPLRAAITGTRVSPPLFGSLRLLGAEKCLIRIDKALAVLEAGD
ncbi:hypothetical protein FACS189498_1680 [Spirochaetia bacterium]|nr:hypothetical protein FACS189498_1680 [Spirochaetia bacterium]